MTIKIKKLQQKICQIGLKESHQTFQLSSDNQFSSNIIKNLKDGGPAGILHLGSISWIIQRPIEVYNSRNQMILFVGKSINAFPIKIQYHQFGSSIGHWTLINAQEPNLKNRVYGNCLFEVVSFQVSMGPWELRQKVQKRLSQNKCQIFKNQFHIKKLQKFNKNGLLIGAGLKIKVMKKPIPKIQKLSSVQNNIKDIIQKCLKLNNQIKQLKQRPEVQNIINQSLSLFQKAIKNINQYLSQTYSQKFQNEEDFWKQIQNTQNVYNIINQYIHSENNNQEEQEKFLIMNQEKNFPLKRQIIQALNKVQEQTNKLINQPLLKIQAISKINQILTKVGIKKLQHEAFKDDEFQENYYTYILQKSQVQNGQKKLILQIVNYQEIITIKEVKTGTVFFKKNRTIQWDLSQENQLIYLDKSKQIITQDITIYHELCHAWRDLKGCVWKNTNDEIVLYKNPVYEKIHSIALQQLETVGCLQSLKFTFSFTQNFYRKQILGLPKEKLRMYYNSSYPLQIQIILQIINKHNKLIKQVSQKVNVFELQQTYYHIFFNQKLLLENNKKFFMIIEEQWRKIIKDVREFRDKKRGQFLYKIENGSVDQEISNLLTSVTKNIVSQINLIFLKNKKKILMERITQTINKEIIQKINQEIILKINQKKQIKKIVSQILDINVFMNILKETISNLIIDEIVNIITSNIILIPVNNQEKIQKQITKYVKIKNYRLKQQFMRIEDSYFKQINWKKLKQITKNSTNQEQIQNQILKAIALLVQTSFQQTEFINQFIRVSLHQNIIFYKIFGYMDSLSQLDLSIQNLKQYVYNTLKILNPSKQQPKSKQIHQPAQLSLLGEH